MSADSLPPPASGESGTAAVLERLRTAATGEGFLRFDRFVDLALYAPHVGYYESPRPRLGSHGDFYTAPQVDPVFGAAVGERVLRTWRQLSRPSRFEIVEVGAGDGTLAADTIRHLHSVLPEEVQFTYTLVERSASMRAKSEERLSSLGASSNVEVRSRGSLGEEGPFVGVVVANELLDALPFRRLIWRSGQWRELGVDVSGPQLKWRESEPADPLPAPAVPPGEEEGQVLEVSPVAEGFVRELADHLEGGVALLIDFGAEESELVRAHHAGTLASVRAHRSAANPLAEPGEQDLSAFVNFTRLRAAARRSGLRELAFRSQAEALVDWGLPSLLDAAIATESSAEAAVQRRLRVKNLLFGFERFRVLELEPQGADASA